MGRFSSTYQAVCDRLTAHCAPSKLLQGVKFEPNPVKEITGVKDLPAIRMMPPDVEETARPVALSDGGFKLRLDIHTSRKEENEVATHLEMIERVMDAINLDDATLDPLLGDRLQKSPLMAARDVSRTELSISSQLSIHLVPRTCLMGRRHV